MKKQLFILIILLVSNLTFTQEKLEPTILILSPNETRYENVFKKEVSEYDSIVKNNNTSETDSYLKSEEFLSQPSNIQEMIKSEIEFAKNIDFFKNASSISEQFLAYRFYEKFPNQLIILKDQRSDGSITSLKSISDDENFQYVLNFSKIELYKKDDIGYAEIEVQLFDNKTNSIIIDKSYTGDWYNPGFEFTCTNESINCTINNALSKALNDIIYTIAINSPTLKKEKQLSQERLNLLSNEYLRKDFDEQFLKTILSDGDNKPFQLLLNDDKTKFVAFFIEQVSSKKFKDLTKNNKDKSVKIISPNDIKDKDFLEEIPRTYAYIIKAVKYNSKWYYEKSNVTYFQANSINEGQKKYFNNLQQWNFFKENSTELNPDFWETNLFEKVPDLKKDPDWGKYGDSIWKTDEVNNRKYIGLYEIVADELRKLDEKEKELYQDKIIKTIIQPKLENLKRNSPNKYHAYSKGIFIHSKNREITINPIVITDSDGIDTMHYNVLFKNSNNLYKWTYFSDEVVKNRFSFSSILLDNLESITSWNFSLDELNDSMFWENYVIARKGNEYLYLEQILE